VGRLQFRAGLVQGFGLLGKAVEVGLPAGPELALDPDEEVGIVAFARQEGSVGEFSCNAPQRERLQRHLAAQRLGVGLRQPGIQPHQQLAGHHPVALLHQDLGHHAGFGGLHDLGEGQGHQAALGGGDDVQLGEDGP